MICPKEQKWRLLEGKSWNWQWMNGSPTWMWMERIGWSRWATRAGLGWSFSKGWGGMIWLRTKWTFQLNLRVFMNDQSEDVENDEVSRCVDTRIEPFSCGTNSKEQSSIVLVKHIQENPPSQSPYRLKFFGKNWIICKFSICPHTFSFLLLLSLLIVVIFINFIYKMVLFSLC